MKELPVDGAGEREREREIDGGGASLFKERSAIYSC